LEMNNRPFRSYGCDSYPHVAFRPMLASALRVDKSSANAA
jgi:hypothetical protein